jgi:thiol:disulfide interchange protein DsbD
MIRALLFCFLWVTSTLVVGADLLRPEQAFKASAHALDGQTIEVRFEIAEGYYLYCDKFRFSVDPDNLRLGQALFPKGPASADETFGDVEVYYHEAVIRLPVERNGSGILPLTVQLTSQGCAADVGVCYPPHTQVIKLNLPELSIDSSAAATESDESGSIARLLKDATFGWALISFFGFGLLLSLTPCTLPMLPILSGIIVGAGRNGQSSVSRMRAFVLALAYVLGMAVVYAVAGIAAGLSGKLISGALQNIWVMGGFALIFVVLALSMFGLFELGWPSFLRNRVSEGTASLQGGSLPGVALMGGLSALLVGPCVAAPLAGALLYIGRTGDALLGGLALFCLALGMGAPLLVVGLSAGALLPKAGPWMVTVNKVFGVILLACALWIVSPFIPVSVQMSEAGTDAAPRALPFERVRSMDELDQRLASAGRPILLDFYADWCVSCKEMERTTFVDPRVREKLSGWLLLQADVTANTPDDNALLARFSLFGPPGIIFFDPAGKELTDVRVVGYQPADKFLKSLAATGM